MVRPSILALAALILASAAAMCPQASARPVVVVVLPPQQQQAPVFVQPTPFVGGGVGGAGTTFLPNNGGLGFPSNGGVGFPASNGVSVNTPVNVVNDVRQTNRGGLVGGGVVFGR